MSSHDESSDMRECARRMLTGSCERLQGLAPGDGQVRAELDRCACALQRLEEGTWGLCTACHRAIGRNRLLALPEAATCAQCSHHRP
jgi:RNA polymerase-binding transcription factor DksA